MVKMDLLQDAKRRFIAQLKACYGENDPDLKSEVVVTRALSTKEAIGDPGRDDFPLLRGKEILMQASFKGASGQAFSADAGNFQGSLDAVLALPLQSIFERALLVASMNSVLRYLNLVGGTVHCRNVGPKECSLLLEHYLREQKVMRVGLVGLQPALLEAMVKALGPERVMVSDLAEAGKERYGVKILDGMDSEKMFEDCQLVFVTGSTLVNGTIDGLMENAQKHGTRMVFYGSTIAGAAILLGLERWCPCST
ncbi:Putative heavy-metal chelation [uncultured archaeon]|nr:Putative heavy-metal chelation [uncultured archaeon]